MDLLLHLGVMISIYVILATSFNLLFGIAGLFAFGHAAFYALGAYTAAILTVNFGWPDLLTLPASFLVTAVVGLVVALPALRISGIYLIIATLAMQSIVLEVIRNLPSLTGGPQGIQGIPAVHLFGFQLSSPGHFLPLAAFVALCCFLATWRIQQSPFGRALKAMRENSLAATSVGKDVLYMKISVFGISAGLAAVAGWLFAFYFTYVGPDSFGLDEVVLILSMVVIGGSGNLVGSVVGAFLLVLIPEALTFVNLPSDIASQIRLIVYGGMLIAFLALRPEGILPEKGLLGRRRAGDADDEAEPEALVQLGPTLVGRNLSKRFGGIVAVDGLDIDVPSGAITGLVGPNGAGKTTAFNLITGFLKPDSGEVRLGDRRIDTSRAHRIVQSGVARSFQDLKLFGKMSVLDNVVVALPNQKGDRLYALFLTPGAVRREERRNRRQAMAILRRLGLEDRAYETAEGLSYAEEKLLVIGRLMATQAEVLLFDEPLSGLDRSALDKIIPILKDLARERRAVGIIEHNLDAIRSLCDGIVFLDNGKNLASGSAEEVMANPEMAKRYFQ